MLTPASDFSSVNALDTLGWALLIFASINSIVAYGSFAEALDHWEASRVSAVMALVPLLTLFFVAVFHYWFPEIVASENLNAFAYFGALVVVIGSSMTALAGQKK